MWLETHCRLFLFCVIGMAFGCSNTLTHTREDIDIPLNASDGHRPDISFRLDYNIESRKLIVNVDNDSDQMFSISLGPLHLSNLDYELDVKRVLQGPYRRVGLIGDTPLLIVSCGHYGRRRHRINVDRPMAIWIASAESAALEFDFWHFNEAPGRQVDEDEDMLPGRYQLEFPLIIVREMTFQSGRPLGGKEFHLEGPSVTVLIPSMNKSDDLD